MRKNMSSAEAFLHVSLQRFGNLTKDLLAGQRDAAQAVRTYV